MNGGGKVIAPPRGMDGPPFPPFNNEKEEGLLCFATLGRCTYDVHAKGGRGVEPKEDVLREVA